MMMITILGGGVAIIGDKQLKTWQHLYKFLDVDKEIRKMDNTGIFCKMTANGVFKAINKYLESKNTEIKENVRMKNNNL